MDQVICLSLKRQISVDREWEIDISLLCASSIFRFFFFFCVCHSWSPCFPVLSFTSHWLSIIGWLWHSHGVLFKVLQDNIITFVRNELERIQKVLSSDHSEYLQCQGGCADILEGEDEEQRRSTKEAFVKITLHFLRRMKQEKLAAYLKSSKGIFPKKQAFPKSR